MKTINSGDVVLSIAGRDQGRLYLVVKVENNFAFITDGKKRKVNALKKKNVKHLSSVFVAGATALAMEIESGLFVANDRVRKMINSLVEKV